MSRLHHHGPSNYNRLFAFGVGLNLIYVAVEAICGFAINSLGLIADAGHNLSDVLSLLLAWAAAWLAARKPTQRRSYGFRRVTLLAALYQCCTFNSDNGCHRMGGGAAIPGSATSEWQGNNYVHRHRCANQRNYRDAIPA